jgi:hypothetical protein
MQADIARDEHTGCCSPDTFEAQASRLLTWVTIGGLALGTYGTFHAVTSLVFVGNPADRPFISARFEAVHRLAVVTVLASQVLQLLGSAALWRRRLLGRTLLITYAMVYLGALGLVQFMRSIDELAGSSPGVTSQHAFLALGQMHLLIYGSVFPMFLMVILTRPWIVKLLRRKGEPIPIPGGAGAPVEVEQRRAA